MAWVKKKIVQVFSDGSLSVGKTFFKKLNRVVICEKDHTTFIFNKKDSSLVLSSKSFENFKTKYLKF
jgi:hypothetical protein